MSNNKDYSWLKAFMQLSKGTEVPEIFSLWCGLMGLSSCLGRRIWIDMGIYKIYPNLLIILIASSGRCRKSTAIGIVESLVREIKNGPNMISQKITPEALIDAIRDVQETEPGVVKETCEGYVIADEVVTFLNKNSYDAGLGSILIQLYDCKDLFEYRTKGRGKEIIKNACLGLLGGTTIEYFRDKFPQEAVGGGLASRIIFVHQSEPTHPIAWTEANPLHVELRRLLREDLKSLLSMHGEVTLTPEAKERYIDIYDTFYHTSPFYEQKSLSGYASRRHVHLLKVAMLMAISNNKRMVIEYGDLDAAEVLLTQNENHLQRAMNLLTASDQGNVIDSIRMTLQARGKVSKEDLIREFSYLLNSRELNTVLETLIRGGEAEAVEIPPQGVFLLWKNRKGKRGPRGS